MTLLPFQQSRVVVPRTDERLYVAPLPSPSLEGHRRMKASSGFLAADVSKGSSEDPRALILLGHERMRGGRLAGYLQSAEGDIGKKGEALDLYARAAKLYQEREKWKDAAETYLLAAYVARKLESKSYEAQNLILAAVMLRVQRSEELMEMAMFAIARCQALGRLEHARLLMRYLLDRSDYFDNRQPSSWVLYEKAADIFGADDVKEAANYRLYADCRSRWAELVALCDSERADDAVNLLTVLASHATMNGDRPSGTEYSLKGGIIWFAVGHWDGLAAQIDGLTSIPEHEASEPLQLLLDFAHTNARNTFIRAREQLWPFRNQQWIGQMLDKGKEKVEAFHSTAKS